MVVELLNLKRPRCGAGTSKIGLVGSLTIVRVRIPLIRLIQFHSATHDTPFYWTRTRDA